jgi:hypothetical protein
MALHSYMSLWSWQNLLDILMSSLKKGGAILKSCSHERAGDKLGSGPPLRNWYWTPTSLNRGVLIYLTRIYSSSFSDIQSLGPYKDLCTSLSPQISSHRCHSRIYSYASFSDIQPLGSYRELLPSFTNPSHWGLIRIYSSSFSDI